MGFFTSVIHKIFGSANDRFLKSLTPKIQQINALAPQYEKFSDTELRQLTETFRARLREGQTLEMLLPEAFAAVREAGRRFLNMRHYDVQLIGGIVLHQGKIAEMVTGEGKTLVATLPAYLNALTGKGVHVVTVNDYLAQRDSDWMAPIYRGLGLTVGAIQSNMQSWERHPHYAADITYGTNNEFGFDYLRDNMKPMVQDQVQGPLNFAIVDEVDSILIDEARTPLIISGSAQDDAEKYREADKIVRALGRPDPKTLENKFFKVEEKDHRVDLTEEGMEKVSDLLGIDNIWGGAHMEWPHLIANALKAHHLYRREQHYEIKEGEVKIVDEFTGRIMEGRRWSDGLHQAIEAKEERDGMGVHVREEQRTLASVTLQNFFRLYDKIAGMTGTAATEAGEFYKIYKLEVVVIPSNRPLIRRGFDDLVFGTVREKFEAMGEEIANTSTLGRPVLVGTTSIERSLLISGHLKNLGYGTESQRIATGAKKRHYVLNARVSYENQNWEADVVAQAGRRMVPETVRADLETFGATAPRDSVQAILAAVTELGKKYRESPGMVIIATNMAGRGTDILLGGHAGHFFYNYLLGEHGAEELEREAEEKKRKKARGKEAHPEIETEIQRDGGEETADEPHNLFSQLHAILVKADALPYPMKDPATVSNPKERDGIQRAVAEAFQAMLNLTDGWFDESRETATQPLFAGLLAPTIFRDFFASPDIWATTLTQFFGRSISPADPVPSRRFIADLIRLAMPIDTYIDRQLELRVAMLQRENRGESGWFEALKDPKWRRRLREAEEWVRDCLFNRILVLCPQFFNREALGINENNGILETSKLSFWFENHKVGGLHVLGTERHESRRVDNQLRGRCGRQGDPGSSQFFLGLDDDLMRIFAGPSVQRILQMAGLRDGQPIQAKMVSNSVERAQKKVEQRNFETRKNLLEYADVMNRQRSTIYRLRQSVLEGLTDEPNPFRYQALRIPKSRLEQIERHGHPLDYETWLEWWDEQGPLKKQLPEGDEYVPLRPELREQHLRSTSLRMVQSAVGRVIAEYAHPTRPAGNWNLEPFEEWFNREFSAEANPITHQELRALSLKDIKARLRERVLWEKDPAIAKIEADTKSLKRNDLREYAENFDHEFNVTLDEDDYARIEQTAPKNAPELFVQIYRDRCHDRRERQIGRNRLDEMDDRIDDATSGWDVPGLCRWLSRSLLLEVTADDLAGKTRRDVEEYLESRVETLYDGREKTIGAHQMRFIEQFTLLQTIDARWKDHLREMDFLRTAVAFAGMTQRDPKIEYKIRGSDMFAQMLTMIEDNFAERVLRMRLVEESELAKLGDAWAGATAAKADVQSALDAGSPVSSSPAAKNAPSRSGGGAGRRGRDDSHAEAEAGEVMQLKREVPKIGPNEPCPCGSGRKYKKCHGAPGAGPLPAEALRKLK